MSSTESNIGPGQIQALGGVLDRLSVAARNSNKLSRLLLEVDQLDGDLEAVEAISKGIDALTREVGRLADEAMAIFDLGRHGWAD